MLKHPAQKAVSFLLAALLTMNSIVPVHAAGLELIPHKPPSKTSEIADAVVDEPEAAVIDAEEEISSEEPPDGEKTNEPENHPPMEVYAEDEQPQTDSPVVQDGTILIYNLKQLQAIGTNAAVCDEDADASKFGKGTALEKLTYSSKGTYALMNDIELTAGDWVLPDDFSGQFTTASVSDSNTLYDAATDTIYLYHPYQLEEISGRWGGNSPVMTEDADPSRFGMGQFIWLDEENGKYLTYNNEHHYVLSAKFTAEMPEFGIETQAYVDKSDTTKVQYEGRDFKGQVIWTDTDGKEYILIGNATQLQKIGSNEQVWTAVYSSPLTGSQLLYGGDADLKQSQNGKKDYSWHAHESIIGSALFYGVNQKTGYYGIATSGEKDTDLQYNNTGHKYSSDEHYIIFRDIDLNNVNWTPISIAGGSVEGRKNMVKGENVTISNVSVNQTAAIDTSKQTGVGFFSSISSTSSSDDYGLSAGTVHISDINLSNVTVTNATNRTKGGTTLVNGLLGGLGSLLGGLVDGLVTVITIGGVDINLRNILNNLLSIQNKDDATFATGAFVGKLYGDVEVKDCHVTNATVSNINNRTGGFVGSMEGVTEYDGLSKALGGLVTLLDKLLNLIPFLGLGDLITILLNNNLIALGSLIPTNYKNVVVDSCSVSLANDIGKNEASSSDENDAASAYVGGFVGRQIGSFITNSSVDFQNHSAKGVRFIGGFSGFTTNAEIQGSLGKSVGAELPSFVGQSVIINSHVTHIKDVAGKDAYVNTSHGIFEVPAETEATDLLTSAYVGGFAGALCNSYAINCSLSDIKTVSTEGSYAGGFAGKATLGWAAGLGEDYQSSTNSQNTNLLSAVGGLLSNVLSGDQTEALLTLAGVRPSVLAGCQITGSNLNVSAKNYAGGMVGQGDGVQIYKSNTTNLNTLRPFKQNRIHYTGLNQASSISGLSSVSATTDFAGGIAGQVTPASAGGILNTTLGLAQFIGFDVSDVTVTGVSDGYTVSTVKETEGVYHGNNFAGGAFGLAMGGDADTITVNNLKSVTAKNYSGGFAGSAGTGALVGGSGINLLGLNLVNIKGLLQVGQGVVLDVKNTDINGVTAGFTVKTTGVHSGNSDVQDYHAGGFIGRSSSAKLTNCNVTNLKSVTSDLEKGKAGGFIGSSITGSLADVAEDGGIGGFRNNGVLNVSGLVSAVSYLIPKYTNCSVTYTNVDNLQVNAAYAGGYIGDMQSGTVDNTTATKDAVNNIYQVKGTYYAGGFAGQAVSGALVKTGGLSLLGGTGLSLNLSDLVSVANAYIPIIKGANVNSHVNTDAENEAEHVTGLMVEATGTDEHPEKSYAGGFVGYGSGVRIQNSNVNTLRHTNVKAPSNLEAADAPSYYNDATSKYAVKSKKYAGGYIGYMDVGSAASVGDGLSLIGSALELTGVLSALNAAVSTIENSDVTGGLGGYSVLAYGTYNGGQIGYAGGFAGKISGGHIHDSDAHNFAYIIGQEAAGGYAGEMEPGSVANLLNNNKDSITNLLKGLVSTDGLASLVQSFVPTIRNSETTCIPCGGAVRADAPTTSNVNGVVKRGMAGGYVGHNSGGQIWGKKNQWMNDKFSWIKTDLPESELKECAAIRIRSVYGNEYAGGFTGLMECASTASAGNLNLLWGLVSVGNLLNLVNATYPTEENTAVYGPLHGMTSAEWKSWAAAVASKKVYADETVIKQTTELNAEELKDAIANYSYGFNVVAGRSDFLAEVPTSGCAGGYAGLMNGGVVTNGKSKGVRDVNAMRSAGGFAGEMLTGGAADIGGISLFGGNVPLLENLGSIVSVLNTFVPVVKTSSIQGYKSGASIKATGTANNQGNAGGFVGNAVGAQIWGDEPEEDDGTQAQNEPDDQEKTYCVASEIATVKGTRVAGGFAGNLETGSVADVNSNTQNGLVGGLLSGLTGNASGLARVLESTLTKLNYCKVSGHASNGLNVTGVDGEPLYAGGFVGYTSGAIMGDPDETNGFIVDNLRQVKGGDYAGGFVGLATVASLASVADGSETGTGNELNLLGLLKAGNVTLLDTFRPWIYNASVKGWYRTTDSVETPLGLTVTAVNSHDSGTLNTALYSGCAGGFAGAVLNGTVKGSSVTNLSEVKAPAYTGGFAGSLGKSGTLDVDKLNVLGPILKAGAGVIDVCGTSMDGCRVSGLTSGYRVTSTKASRDGLGRYDKSETNRAGMSGGFVGFADLARINDCSAENLGQVTSAAIAGGFAGKTTMAYLADIDTGSTALLTPITNGVNLLLSILYVGGLEHINLIHIPDNSILDLGVLDEGDFLSVTLLGLKIAVGLNKNDGQGNTDLAVITIGDSTVEIPCTQDGKISEEALKITLIKANRTKITNSTVTGIANGYDVFGGGATKDDDGADLNGMAGGFVGLDDEGYLIGNRMIRADTIKGKENRVGEFIGTTQLDSSYQSKAHIVGQNNTYEIHRNGNAISTLGGKLISDTVSGGIFTVKHYGTYGSPASGAVLFALDDTDSATYISGHEVFENAKLDDDDLNVWVSASKAVLMSDTDNYPNTQPTLNGDEVDIQDVCAEKINLNIQKLWQDNNDEDEKRPDLIRFYVEVGYKDGSAIAVEKTTRFIKAYDETTMTFTDDLREAMKFDLTYLDATQDGGNVWKGKIEGLPLADASGKTYVYTVAEVPVAGYINKKVTKTNNETLWNQIVGTLMGHETDDGYTFAFTNSIDEESDKDSTAKIAGVTLSIGDTIDMNFYVNGINDRTVKNYYMGFFNGETPLYDKDSTTTPVYTVKNSETGQAVPSGEADAETAYLEPFSGSKNLILRPDERGNTSGETLYGYTWSNTYAYNMGDKITAKLYRKVGNTYVFVSEKTFSIPDYAELAFSQQMSGNGSEHLYAMLIDMLNYGAYTKDYATAAGWNVSTSNSVRDILDDHDDWYTKAGKGSHDAYQAALKAITKSAYSAQTYELTPAASGEVEASSIDAQVSIDNGMSIGLGFSTNLKAQEGKNLKGWSAEFNGERKYVQKDTTTNVSIGAGVSTIPPFFWDKEYELNIYNAAGASFADLTYSVTSYCVAQMNDKPDDKLSNMLKSMLLYNQSAKAWWEDVADQNVYFNSNGSQ